jgi:hypothetical protein
VQTWAIWKESAIWEIWMIVVLLGQIKIEASALFSASADVGPALRNRALEVHHCDLDWTVLPSVNGNIDNGRSQPRWPRRSVWGM